MIHFNTENSFGTNLDHTGSGPELLQIWQMSPFQVRPIVQKDTGADVFYQFGPNFLAHVAHDGPAIFCYLGSICQTGKAPGCCIWN